jgi:hypothetical protein
MRRMRNSRKKRKGQEKSMSQRKEPGQQSPRNHFTQSFVSLQYAWTLLVKIVNSLMSKGDLPYKQCKTSLKFGKEESRRI